jgi:hemerythrin-like domain-containing protein/rubredoxin
MALFRCQPCGYIYNESVGDPKRSIPAGTKFADLPAGWVCPVCGASHGQFEEITDPAMMKIEPIALLMIEHVLVKRIIPVLEREVAAIKRGGAVDSEFMMETADFFHKYIDIIHHGKEEHILFRELETRTLTPELRDLLDRLTVEHQQSRAHVKALVSASIAYAGGAYSKKDEIIEYLEFFIELYPRHIKAEDETFFPKSMEYFSAVEQAAMLEEMREFDKAAASNQYRQAMELWEKRNLN